jgi:adenine-specific DNA-methyltransferase
MLLSVGDAKNLDFNDNTFDLTMGSPPYLDARHYGRKDIARKVKEWSKWMTACTLEAARVTDGPVIWVVSGVGAVNYQPGPETLVADIFANTELEILRPNIWTKNATPTGKGWFSNDWEFVLAFAKKVPLKTWNPEALATPLKYKAGGHFRQRKKSGERSRGSDYPEHTMRKRPSNVHYVTVGGGHMGWPGATRNEAPYPEKLVARFIQALTNPGDKVLDPFAGSFTTPATAELLGRVGVGVDIRPCQIELGKERQLYIDEILKAQSEDNESIKNLPVRPEAEPGIAKGKKNLDSLFAKRVETTGGYRRE